MKILSEEWLILMKWKTIASEKYNESLIHNFILLFSIWCGFNYNFTHYHIIFFLAKIPYLFYINYDFVIHICLNVSKPDKMFPPCQHNVSLFYGASNLHFTDPGRVLVIYLINF